jgi:murein DD-endopeptidase MepM/ murein hydrolase activator NlpD
LEEVKKIEYRARNLKKNRLTFLFIPDSSGTPRELSVAKSTVYAVLGFALLLVIGSFYFSANFFSNKVSEEQLSRLQAENEQLSARYEQMRWNLLEVEDRYTELVSREVKVRALFNLPEIDAEERQLGIGGPEPVQIADMTATAKEAYITEMEVEHLLRLSKFELEKYEEVEDALLNVKTKLRHTPSIWPTTGWNSRGYGMKYDPFTGYKQMHRGIDIANKTNTPIIATADGKIKIISTATQLGKMITIDHGYGYRTRYGHLAKILVKRGQKVKRGELIGLMGSTGYSTGPHLHYEVIRSGKFLSPAKYILNEMSDFASTKR